MLPGVTLTPSSPSQLVLPVFDMVDWKPFIAALMASFLKRLFVLKWANGLLPFQ
jgi:hypothetical protein